MNIGCRVERKRCFYIYILYIYIYIYLCRKNYY